MKLEYRVLELAKESENQCSYCFIDYSDPTLLDFNTAPATYEMVALEKDGSNADIAFICNDCKIDYDNNVLPRCEKCDRLMRNKSLCYCHKIEKKTTTPTKSELISQSFSYRLEKKTRELEKELSTAKEDLNIEREEITKFHEKSEEWSKRQKQELLDRIKELETELERMKKLIPQELVDKLNAKEEEINKLKVQLAQLQQQNGQLTAQFEVKETKR
jgi:hypothetical protein